MRRDRGKLSAAIGAALLTALLGATTTAGNAFAVPPPPPNPSDSEIQASRDRAQAKAGRVGELANQLTGAEAELAELKSNVGRKLELAKKAMIDLRRAKEAAEQAERAADSAKAAVDVAGQRIERARKKLDKFIAASFNNGNVLGSGRAYLGAQGPEELLSRSQLLHAVADSSLNALDNMRQAQTAKANKEAAARAALRRARDKRAAAEQAEQQAQAAKAAAISAREKQASRIAELEAKREDIQHQLYQARQQVDSLRNQRESYQDWLARKRAEQRRQRQQQAAAAAAAAAASSASSSGAGGSGGSANQAPPSSSATSLIEQVIARAKSQLGVTYAWGGGNAYGPTHGIRDGGVADAHGDWKKIGFDCSGLMSYAFAPVKIIPSYSGYQYNAGQKVPVSQAARGDMLFWGPGGSTHVALYLGNGMMIEAPFSGGHVRIVPVRWYGIAPYAVRIAG